MTHLRGYRADAALIPEPEDEKLVRANTGVLWFQIKVQGHARARARDGRRRERDRRRLPGDPGALRKLEAEWNVRKAGARALRERAAPDQPECRAASRAANGPPRCRPGTVDCRIAIYPGMTAAEAAREIEQAVADFARQDSFLANNPPRVIFNGFFVEGYVLEPGLRGRGGLARAHQAATGKPLESFTTVAYLDARVYALYDKVPALCYGPTSRNVHGVDECVSLESVRRSTTAMALFIAEWCGLEPAR